MGLSAGYTSAIESVANSRINLSYILLRPALVQLMTSSKYKSLYCGCQVVRSGCCAFDHVHRATSPTKGPCS